MAEQDEETARLISTYGAPLAALIPDLYRAIEIVNQMSEQDIKDRRQQRQESEKAG